MQVQLVYRCLIVFTVSSGRWSQRRVCPGTTQTPLLSELGFSLPMFLQLLLALFCPARA